MFLLIISKILLTDVVILSEANLFKSDCNTCIGVFWGGVGEGALNLPILPPHLTLVVPLFGPELASPN